MKRTLILFIALTIIAISNAQVITVQGGPSFSKLNWDLERINTQNPKYDKTLTGYFVFVGVDYLDKKFFNLSSNIGMIRKGGRHELSLSEGGSLNDMLTLDYISVNTNIDLKYPIKEIYFPFISIGPRLDYLLAHSEHFDVIQDLDKLKNISVGMILGLGFKINVSKIQLGLRADYFLNFNPVADWRELDPGNGGHIKVNTFALSLSVGYRFNI